VSVFPEVFGLSKTKGLCTDVESRRIEWSGFSRNVSDRQGLADERGKERREEEEKGFVKRRRARRNAGGQRAIVEGREWRREE
jgi:hypothetical protein